MHTNLEKTLHHIFSKYRGSILLTYGLTLLENLFELIHALTIGIAINGLLKQSYGSMTPFAAAWLVHALISVFRQDYWGQGYATESAQLLLSHGLKELCFNPIVAAVDP